MFGKPSLARTEAEIARVKNEIAQIKRKYTKASGFGVIKTLDRQLLVAALDQQLLVAALDQHLTKLKKLEDKKRQLTHATRVTINRSNKRKTWR